MSGPEYDLAIVGSGGAAFSAAIAARERDLRVVIIERGTVGGTCVNVGCIPAKALLAAAAQRHRAGAQRFPGIRTDAGLVDMATLVAGKDAIVQSLRQEKHLDLADRHAIELVHGDAHFVDGPALDVDGRTIVAAAYPEVGSAGPEQGVKMQSRTTALIITGTLVGGLGTGCIGGAAASPTAAASPSESREMGGVAGPMMDAEHAKPMRDRDMRRLHEAMVRERARTMRDPEMRRRETRALRALPQMASRLRRHMEG